MAIHGELCSVGRAVEDGDGTPVWTANVGVEIEVGVGVGVKVGVEVGNLNRTALARGWDGMVDSGRGPCVLMDAAACGCGC